MSEYIKPRKEFIHLYNKDNFNELVKSHKIGTEYNISLVEKVSELENTLKKLTNCLIEISKDKYEANPWTIIDSKSAKKAQKVLKEINEKD